MTDTRKQLEHLSEIRTLMERSARFLSLSGLSGVWAGACALIGVTLVYSYLEMSPFDAAGRFYSGKFFYYDRALSANKWGMNYEYAFIMIAAGVFAAALAGGWFFTARKARKRGERIWDATSRRLLVALMIPLLTGGLLCLALLYRGYISLLAPCTLIFYGLALVNGGKFTLRDVEHLGRFEIALGLLGVYFPGYGLELWTLGFGFLHIVYGLWMYWKYDRKQ